MKRKLERLVALAVYTGLGAGFLFVVAETGVRLLGLGERPSALAGRVDSEAYSYFDWRQDFFADLAHADFSYDYEPFSLWRHRDTRSTLFNVVDGNRVTWEPGEDPDRETFTVYALGGSTLFGAESPDELTIPSLLAKKLGARNALRRFVVRNRAVSGFTIANDVHLLVELLAAGHRPDGVVVYAGINDVYYRIHGGEPHYLYERFRGFGTYTANGVLERLAGRSRLVTALRRGTVSEEPPTVEQAVLERRAAAVLESYLGQVETVRHLAAGYGFDVHIFWPPHLFVTRKAKSAEEAALGERYARYAPPFELAAARGELLAKAGVHDLRHAFDGVEETIFVDFCHVTAIGNEAVAEAMVEILPW